MTRIETLCAAIEAARALGAMEGGFPELSVTVEPALFEEARQTWQPSTQRYRNRALSATTGRIIDAAELDAGGALLRVTTFRPPTDAETQQIKAWGIKPGGTLPVLDEGTEAA